MQTFNGLLNWTQIHRRKHKNMHTTHSRSNHTQTHTGEHLKTSEISLAKHSEIKIKTLQQHVNQKPRFQTPSASKKKKKEREEAEHSLSSSWSLSLYLAWVIGVSRPSLWLSNIHYHVGNLPKDGCMPSTLFNSHLWLFEKIKLGASLCSLLTAQILHRDRQDGACCPQMAIMETNNNKPCCLIGVTKNCFEYTLF